MGQHLYKPIHRCSIVGCLCTTTATAWADPRDRWMLGLELKDDDGSLVIVNLCPQHTREQFDLQEAHYAELEKSEKLVRETVTGRPA